MGHFTNVLVGGLTHAKIKMEPIRFNFFVKMGDQKDLRIMKGVTSMTCQRIEVPPPPQKKEDK